MRCLSREERPLETQIDLSPIGMRGPLTRRQVLYAFGAATVATIAGSGIRPPQIEAVMADPVGLTPPLAAVPRAFFGMHIHFAAWNTPWPKVPFATWRLWDASVMWSEIQPQRGVYSWDLLDSLVNLAEKHGVEPALTLGMTPTWASARPGDGSDYGPQTSAAEPANMQDWVDYVTAVATRYKGRIHYYEMWNEPNGQYFTGTMATLVLMTKLAHDALKRVDPANQVISPAITRDTAYLDTFLAAGGGQYIDVLGFHFYSYPDPPESIVGCAQRVGQILANYGMENVPIWNTETGYHADNLTTDDARMGYVSRMYLLNWALGISRFNWYAWDNHGFCTLWMTESDNATLTPAANAYVMTQKWLLNARMTACTQDGANTWVCKLVRADGQTVRIVWNARGTAQFRVPTDWNVNSVQSLFDRRQRIVPGTQLLIGLSPLLFDFIPDPIPPPTPIALLPPSPRRASTPTTNLSPEPAPMPRR